MELIVKHFSELSLEELVDIYKLRVSVFVVEQNCAYQEIDDADKVAYPSLIMDIVIISLSIVNLCAKKDTNG